jgi:hypothetical protein
MSVSPHHSQSQKTVTICLPAVRAVWSFFWKGLLSHFYCMNCLLFQWPIWQRNHQGPYCPPRCVAELRNELAVGHCWWQLLPPSAHVLLTRVQTCRRWEPLSFQVSHSVTSSPNHLWKTLVHVIQKQTLNIVRVNYFIHCTYYTIF